MLARGNALAWMSKFGCPSLGWADIKKATETFHCFGGQATPLGFEPRLSGPKPLVLPLHYGVIGSHCFNGEQLNANIYTEKMLLGKADTR